jgi:glycine hydroxymethyltransferase
MIKETFEDLMREEQKRQNITCELIASENFPSKRILNMCGSCLTAKYAEGYPGKRYYGGCQWIDKIEQKAIDNACELFNCNFANVQPHCGSSANQAVYRAFCKPGDTVLGMNLDSRGSFNTWT